MSRTAIAILSAAVAYFVLGAGWFTYFMPQWIAGLGFTDAQVAAMKAHPSAMPYVISFLCNVVMACALAWVMRRAGAGAAAGVRVGLLVGVCFAAAAMVTEMTFEARSLTFMMIAAGYPVIGCAIMGGVIGAIANRGALRAHSAHA